MEDLREKTDHNKAYFLWKNRFTQPLTIEDYESLCSYFESVIEQKQDDLNGAKERISELEDEIYFLKYPDETV